MAETDEYLSSVSFHQLRHENQQLIERNSSLQELLCEAEESTKNNLSQLDKLKKKNSKLSVQVDEQKQQILEFQREIDSHKSRMKDVQKDFNQLLHQKSVVDVELSSMKEQNVQLTQKNIVMEKDIIGKENAITDLQTSLYEKEISISELQEQNMCLSVDLEQRESELSNLSQVLRSCEEKIEILEFEKQDCKVKIRRYESELLKSRIIGKTFSSSPDISQMTDSDLDLVECLIEPYKSASFMPSRSHSVSGSFPIVSGVGDVNCSAQKFKSPPTSHYRKSLKAELQELSQFSLSPQMCGQRSRKISVEESRQLFKLNKSKKLYSSANLDDDIVASFSPSTALTSPVYSQSARKPVAESTPNLNHIQSLHLRRRPTTRCKTLDFKRDSNEMLEDKTNNNSWPSTPRREKSIELVDSENTSLKEEFERIVISMRSNFETIEQRFKIHRSCKDTAERNVKNEVAVIDQLLTNFRSCPGYSLELVSKLSTSIEILQNCIKTLSYKSEQLGAVEQAELAAQIDRIEERLNKAFKTMIQYVERLKMLHESSKKENEESKAKMGDSNGLNSGVSSPSGRHKRSYSLFIPAGKGSHQSLLQSLPARTANLNQSQDLDSLIKFASPACLSSLPESLSGDSEVVYQKGLKHGLRLKTENDVTRMQADQEKFSDDLDELREEIECCKNEIVPATDDNKNIKSRIRSFLMPIVLEFQPYWNGTSSHLRRSLAIIISIFAFLILIFAVLLPIHRKHGFVEFTRSTNPHSPV